MKPFWERPLAQLTATEWEALCDGCGQCCLNKLQDEDTDEVIFTRVACNLLDTSTGRCCSYENRFELVPDCLSLNKDKVADFFWLPATCAYRLRHNNLPLYPWHPLLAGQTEALRAAGQAVSTMRCVTEQQAGKHWVKHWQRYRIDMKTL